MVKNKRVLLTFALILLTFSLATTGFIMSGYSSSVDGAQADISEDFKRNWINSLAQKIAETKPKFSPQKAPQVKEATKQKVQVTYAKSEKALASKYVKLASFEPVWKGVKCSNGGYRVDEGYDVNENELLDPKEILETKYVCEDEVAEKLASIDPKKVDFFEVSINEDKNHNGKVDADEQE